MEIERLTTYKAEDFEALAELMAQLSSRLALTEGRLREVLADPGVRLYVLRDSGRIVGCAELCVYESLSARKAMVEEVVVLEEYRGRGLGRALLEHLLAEARREGPMELYLTSNQKRVAANALYRSLGFEQKSTNCYRMDVGTERNV